MRNPPHLPPRAAWLSRMLRTPAGRLVAPRCSRVLKPQPPLPLNYNPLPCRPARRPSACCRRRGKTSPTWPSRTRSSSRQTWGRAGRPPRTRVRRWRAVMRVFTQAQQCEAHGMAGGRRTRACTSRPALPARIPARTCGSHCLAALTPCPAQTPPTLPCDRLRHWRSDGERQGGGAGAQGGRHGKSRFRTGYPSREGCAVACAVVSRAWERCLAAATCTQAVFGHAAAWDSRLRQASGCPHAC